MTDASVSLHGEKVHAIRDVVTRTLADGLGDVTVAVSYCGRDVARSNHPEPFNPNSKEACHVCKTRVGGPADTAAPTPGAWGG